MDPKACLTYCSQALADRNINLAREYLQAYSAWRAKGGFEPTMSATAELQSDLDRINLELAKIIASVHGIVPKALIDKRDSLEQAIAAAHSIKGDVYLKQCVRRFYQMQVLA